MKKIANTVRVKKNLSQKKNLGYKSLSPFCAEGERKGRKSFLLNQNIMTRGEQKIKRGCRAQCRFPEWHASWRGISQEQLSKHRSNQKSQDFLYWNSTKLGYLTYIFKKHIVMNRLHRSPILIVRTNALNKNSSYSCGQHWNVWTDKSLTNFKNIERNQGFESQGLAKFERHIVNLIKNLKAWPSVRFSEYKVQKDWQSTFPTK